MRWYGLWYGGASYATPEPADLEEFASLDAAMDALQSRRDSGASHRQHFAYVGRPPVCACTPAVGDDSEILLYPSRDDLAYPAKRAFFHRGQPRTEDC